MCRHRLIALLLLVTSLAACQSWRAETATPQEPLENSPPKKIRVVRRDGAKQVLNHAQLRSDTLWGVMPEPPIALSDVQVVETRHRQLGNSLLLTGGIITGLFLVVAVSMTPPLQ